MSTSELRRTELLTGEMRILGPTETVEESGDVTVTVSVDGEEIASQSAAGVYGLLWIPINEGKE